MSLSNRTMSTLGATNRGALSSVAFAQQAPNSNTNSIGRSTSSQINNRPTSTAVASLPRNLVHSVNMVNFGRNVKPSGSNSITLATTCMIFPPDTNPPLSSKFYENLPEDVRQRYDNAFEVLDTDYDGYVSKDETRIFLLTGQIPNRTFAEMWSLADLDHDMRLNLKEFRVALHLIAGKLNGLDLPFSVPPSLLSDAEKFFVPPRPFRISRSQTCGKRFSSSHNLSVNSSATSTSSSIASIHSGSIHKTRNSGLVQSSISLKEENHNVVLAGNLSTNEVTATEIAKTALDTEQGGMSAITIPPGSKYFPYEQLRARREISGLDISRLEAYLTTEEFIKVFSMPPEKFAELPIWNRNGKKQKVGLF